jgi:hypothetical protein
MNGIAAQKSQKGSEGTTASNPKKPLSTCSLNPNPNPENQETARRSCEGTAAPNPNPKILEGGSAASNPEAQKKLASTKTLTLSI